MGTETKPPVPLTVLIKTLAEIVTSNDRTGLVYETLITDSTTAEESIYLHLLDKDSVQELLTQLEIHEIETKGRKYNAKALLDEAAAHLHILSNLNSNELKDGITALISAHERTVAQTLDATNPFVVEVVVRYPCLLVLLLMEVIYPVLEGELP